ncbi:hypothetical protein M378DRAFT_637167 [Amanita muscaria Koide BX008]|uniref:Uncharacterized protein n=1 Tax=Amanita muscaria (strain Koide BX008) TaxID=946122 RepID=A0A0C2WR44_AMAMK|nr:hypothetical protein M378DRAFT_637167 [Amanita muscaria Koide BX008]
MRYHLVERILTVCGLDMGAVEGIEEGGNVPNIDAQSGQMDLFLLLSFPTIQSRVSWRRRKRRFAWYVVVCCQHQ